MLTQKKIHELFEQLNEALRTEGQKGEIGIVGGAVMCLVYNARASTKDIDGIFEPATLIRTLAKKIAINNNLTADWLNDGAKGFLVPGFSQEEVVTFSNLRIWAPDPRYMLAMKSISGRFDSNDRDDVIFLIKKIGMKSANDVFDLIESYYPKNIISSKTTFFIEEVFEELLL